MKKHSPPATISLEPNKHELLDLLEHYQNRRYVDAEKLALLLTNKFENHPFGWKVLGAIFNQTGRLSEGLIACQKSALLEPKNPEAHNNLGNTLQKLERLKEAEEEEFKGKSLLSYFTELERGNTRLGVAGSIRTPIDAERVMSQGVDWIMLGRAGMLHHDFPKLYEDNPRFSPIEIPVTRDYLLQEGLSDKFINYISKWGFTSELSKNAE